MSATGTDDLLPEMLREAELVLAQQLHAIDELDDKSEQLLALGIGGLGGGIALLAYVGDRGRLAVPVGFTVGWSVGFVLNAAGLVAFLLGYVGPRAAPSVGPNLEWIAGKVEDAGWTRNDHFANVLRGYPAYFASNAAIISHGARRHRVGLVLVVLGVAAYAGAAIYLLGGAIG